MTPDPTIIGQVAELTLQAPSESWLGLFDQLQVWRSSDPSGPFTELTGALWAPPRLPVGGGEVAVPAFVGRPLALTGLVLSFVLDEQYQIDITFTGPDPVSLQSAASQVTAGSGGRLKAWVADEGVFVVEYLAPGNKHILRVIKSEASVLLGFVTELYAYGKDARIGLVAEQSSYSFVDAHSQKGAFYTTRYSSSTLLDLSEFSVPFPSTASNASAADVIRGVLDLVDLAGRPKQNREVVIAVKFSGQQVGAFTMVDTQLSALTDSSGHVEFPLVRGSKIVVVVSGTKLARDVVVPEDPNITVFNLFDPGVGSDDLFVVQKPIIDWAVRRSF